MPDISGKSGDAGRVDHGSTGTDRGCSNSVSAGASWQDRLFAGIDKAKFKQMVRPGDTLELETTIIRSKGPVGVGEAIATVNGKLAAKAELTFAVK